MENALIFEARREGYNIGQIKNTLTVGELIDLLEGFDYDTPVYLSHDNGYTYGGLNEYDIEEIC